MSESFDVIVVGGGPAGEVAVERVAKGGLSVALVERELVGGECSYWGCIPSKTLIRPGDVLAAARRVPGATEAVTGPIDAGAAFAQRDYMTSSWSDEGQERWLGEVGATLVRGHGRLDGERTVVVERDGSTTRLEARGENQYFQKMLSDYLDALKPARLKRVLEVGCGTGQLTNFLGISCRRVIGTDMCLNSLRLAEKFRREHGLNRVRFVQMNLFKPCFKPGQFDVVLCNGVLHHTADPRGGFESIERLVRPGGHIVIGLYNTYGRLMMDLRRNIFRLTGGRGKWIDAYLRGRFTSEDKRRAWFNDQYRHPHESKHTIGEVLEWFDSRGLQFVRGVPSVTSDSDGLRRGNLFHPTGRGTQLDHFLVQAREIWTGSREGGFFIMIAKKPVQGPAPRIESSQNGSGALLNLGELAAAQS